jgi:hypothetical protein
MRLDFNEVPDYASILEKSYQSVNRSYNEREEAERRNDERRIKNAGMPLKMIEAIAQFAPKAKKLADGLKLQQQKRQQKEFNQSKFANYTIDQLKAVEEREKLGNKFVRDEYFAKLKVAKKINEEGKIIEALDTIDSSTYKKIKYGLRNALIKNHKAGSLERFNKVAGDISGLSLEDKQDAYRRFRQADTDDFDDYGDVFQKDLEEHYASEEKLFMAENKKIYQEQWLVKQDGERREILKGILKFDNDQEGRNNFQTNVMEHIETVKNEKGYETFGEAYQFVMRDALEMVKSGDIKPEIARKLEALYVLHRGKKGAPKELILDSHSKMLAQINWDKELHDAETEYYELEEEEAENYENSKIADMKQQRKDNGSFTEKDLADFLRTNWDYDTYGTPSSSVTGFATDEDKNDADLKPYLQIQWDQGGLTEDMVYKLKSAKDRETWMERVGTTSPNGVSKDDLKDAISASKDIRNDLASTKGFKLTNNKQVLGNVQKNAEWYFPGLYADAMKDANSPADAYIKAKNEMKAIIATGKWDTLKTASTDVNERKRNLSLAQGHLKNDMTVVKTGIIAGTEGILEEAAELHNKNIAHPMYVQLANELRIDGIRPHPLALQEYQLEVKSKLMDTGKPVKSVVVETWEKQPETTRELLSAHASPARLTRAKIEAFFGEGDNVAGTIDYNDPAISSMVNEILSNKDGLYTEFLNDREVDPRYLFGKSEVDKDEKYRTQFKKLSNRVSYSKWRSERSDGVAAEKLKEFIRSGLRLPGMLLEDVFATESAAFGFIGEGLEQRREEVKKQKNKRKRN